MSMIDTRSIPDLLENAVHQASNLVRDEMALARAEISEKASLMAGGLAMVAVGAVLVLPALVLILLAIASLLIDGGMDPWLANLLTGAGALLIGALIAWIGASRFSAKSLAPRQTLEEIRRDRTALREMAR